METLKAEFPLTGATTTYVEGGAPLVGTEGLTNQLGGTYISGAGPPSGTVIEGTQYVTDTQYVTNNQYVAENQYGTGNVVENQFVADTNQYTTGTQAVDQYTTSTEAPNQYVVAGTENLSESQLSSSNLGGNDITNASLLAN